MGTAAGPGYVLFALAVTVVVAVVFGRAALRGGAGRALRVCVAVTYTIWCAGCVALLLGVSELAYWAGTRSVVLVLFVVGFALSAAERRTRRDLAVAVLDGWSTVGALLVVGLIVLRAQPLAPLRQDFTTPAAIIAIAALGYAALTVAVIVGLASRDAPGRRNVALLGASSAVSMIGDLVAVATDHAVHGVGFWLASALLIALSVDEGTANPFESANLDPDAPRRIRFWQLPVLPVLCVALTLRSSWVEQALALSILIAVFTQLIAYSRGTERLYDDLAARTRRHDQILRDSRDAVLQLDQDGVVEYASPATATVLGEPPEHLAGSRLQDRLHPRDLAASLELLRVSRELTDARQVRFRCPDGSWRHVEWTVSARADAPGWVLSGRDTSDRVRMHEELRRQAGTDALTELLNRTAFLAEVDARLAAGGEAVLLVADLDNFKPVNDTLGQDSGDELLRRVAGWLRETAAPGDAVARLGGDEFAVLTAGGVRAGEELAAAVVTAMSGVDAQAEGRVPITASVGVASGTGTTAVSLLRDADLAMYRAKLRGGGCAVVFEPWMSERVLERSRQRAELQDAVRAGALALHLQPVVELGSGRWAGFEALVRWPVGAEMRSPAMFLPLAEETGLIVPMDTWMLHEALAEIARWPDGEAGIAVNVSAQQLARNDFEALVAAALEESGVSPRRLTLEITEQAAVQDLGRTASRLEPLRERGVHVAVDDFGTGFSSLQYLSRLPVDVLKIDRKFVSGLGRAPEDEVLVRSMIRLAADLGLGVIAEGVETEEQAELLRGYGCELAQGYLFSRPRPAAELQGLRPAPAAVPRPRQPGSGAPRPAGAGRG